jgi:hypothetical protein
MKKLLRLQRLAFVLGFGALALANTDAVVAGVDGVELSASHLWSHIKGDNYDKRAHFANGANLMLAKLDEQIGELKAKRAVMTTDTKDWDFAMKRVQASRVLLAGRVDNAVNATTPETWGDAKDNVGEAWHSSQLAVDNMNSTRTS